MYGIIMNEKNGFFVRTTKPSRMQNVQVFRKKLRLESKVFTEDQGTEYNQHKNNLNCDIDDADLNENYSNIDIQTNNLVTHEKQKSCQMIKRISNESTMTNDSQESIQSTKIVIKNNQQHLSVSVDSSSPEKFFNNVLSQTHHIQIDGLTQKDILIQIIIRIYQMRIINYQTYVQFLDQTINLL